MIKIEALRYTWPKASAPCLAIDHLRIAAGQSVFLHGPSGSGKSTLLGLLAGVLLASEGEVRVAGQSWHELSNGRRDAYRGDHIGYIFQQFNLLPYLSVLDNVLLPCRLSARRARNASAHCGSAKQEAKNLLTQIELAPALWQQPAHRLSVGQQQRVAAARALIGQPDLLIADEPTSALDSAVRDVFIRLLLQRPQTRAQPLTVVFVSHDLALAPHFDRTISLPEINRATVQGELA